MQPEPSNRTNQIVGVLVALIVLLAGVGGWWVGTQQKDGAEVSTEGPVVEGVRAEDSASVDEPGAEEGDAEPTSDPADPAASVEPSEPAELETATAVPGAPLVFIDTADPDAPGGYNVWQNGRSNGLYYVLSTAPGVTWESQQAECGGECHEAFRNDTLYTYDGSDWNRADLGDRFVTDLATTDTGLLYTLSTGSVAGPALELGTSADTGSTWTWTPLDVSNQPGADDGHARVLTAERDGEILVVVHNPADIDWDEAAALARSAGLDVTAERIWGVTLEGIEFAPAPVETDGVDCAQIDIEFHEQNSPSSEYPFGDVHELTEEQEAELDAWYLAEQAAWAALELAAAEHMATVDGCEDYAVCLTDSVSIRNDIAANEDAMWAELGFGPEIDWDTITEEQSAALDAAYAAEWAPYDDWFMNSGCTEVLGWDEAENVEWYTWDELGVTTPDSWNGSLHAHSVVDGVATDLGAIDDDPVWIVSLDATANGWDLHVESGGHHDTNLRHLTSTTGADWTVVSEGNDWDSIIWWEPAVDAAGNEWRVDWQEDEEGGSRLVKVGPDGGQQVLSLDDLAATSGLDLSDYSIDNVRTGAYGTIVWAANWNFGDDYAVDSVVFFSSDGIEWGATALDGTYVVDAIVGDTEVLVFGERPDLVNGDTPQPVLIGTAG